MQALTREQARELAAQQTGTVLLESAGTQPADLNRSWLFQQPEAWLEAHTLDEVTPLLEEMDRARAQGLWAAGYLSYEAGFAFEPRVAPAFRTAADQLPLVAFGLYRSPSLLAPQTHATHSTRAQGLLKLDVSLSEAEYATRFARVQAAIAAGDTYQLNLTLEATGFHTTPLALYEHMLAAQPVAFAAMLRVGERTIVSASPELFFSLHGRDILTRPMKGTAPRSSDPAVDAQTATALARSVKNRAENVMIVDLLRNDLGRIAETGSVRVHNLFHVEALPTVFQMTSDVRAMLREEVDTPALFRSLFPCGSIVGAPKIRSMQILRELEARNRGIYTGAIGYLSPTTGPEPSQAVFSVAIRTAVLHDTELRMGIGSGVVADSNAHAEFRECLLKAKFLLDRNFSLIESLRWEHGACALLELHMARLSASAQALGFTFDRTRIDTALHEHTAPLLPKSAYKLRLLLHPNGSLSLSSAPLAAEPAEATHPIAISPQRIHSRDPWLRHKTTRRAFYDSALTDAQQQGLTDLLFLNEHGHLTEGAIHNLFVRHGNRWRTPPLSDGVLPGVFRRHLLDTQPNIEEAHLTVDDLQSADEIWLTNAVRGKRLASLANLHPPV